MTIDDRTYTPASMVQTVKYTTKTVEREIDVPTIEMLDENGNQSGGKLFQSTTTADSNIAPGQSQEFGSELAKNTGGGQSGSSGGKATEIKLTKKQDVVERYKELNDLLDDV
jgi:hypothetical protein